MSAADIIATYGAVLATLLAALQVVQWRNSKKFLSVKYTEFFGNDDSCVEVVISNRGQFPVQLDFVSAGYSVRYYRRPWGRDCLNVKSMARIEQYDENGAVLAGVLDGMLLQPGAIVRAGIRKSEFEQMTRSGCPRNGFSYRPTIWIEHSQSDVEICKVIAWTE